MQMNSVTLSTQTLSSTVGIFTGFNPGRIWAGLAGTWGLIGTATAGPGGGGSASRVNVELFNFTLTSSIGI